MRSMTETVTEEAYRRYVALAEEHADEHPGMEPRTVSANIAAEMEVPQLRAFAISMLTTFVVSHRRRLAREAEERAVSLAVKRMQEARAAEQERQRLGREAEQERAREYEQQAQEASQRLTDDMNSDNAEVAAQARKFLEQYQDNPGFPLSYRRAIGALRGQQEQEVRDREREEAEREQKNRESRAGSEEFFQCLYDDPATEISWLHTYFPDYFSGSTFPGSLAFHRWCAGRFDGWFQQVREDMAVLTEEARRDRLARNEVNREASRLCERHGRRECTGQLTVKGQKPRDCHRASVAGGLCSKHGVTALESWTPDDWWLAQTFYPGGPVKLRTDELIADVARKTRIEVTEELLSTRFALGDGTMVTWGTATISQHRQRIEMLAKNAAGIVETAGRHKAAIYMCEEAEVDRLDDLPSAA